MITQLQIMCVPENWDTSTITAAGVALQNGRTLLPRDVMASDLPGNLLDVWHAAVSDISTIDPGGWAATLICAKKETIVDYSAADLETEALPTITQITLHINRCWDDKTTAPPLTKSYQDPNIIAFFDTLTSAAFWDAAARR